MKSRTWKAWTNSEIAFLENNYQEKTYIEIAKELNRTAMSVRSQAFNLGIRRPSGTFKRTLEYRRKLSKACKNRTSSWKGKKLSKSHKRKISESMKGNSVWNKGGSLSEKHKERVSKSMKGKNKGRNNGMWRGGKSFEPYTPEFNNELKEEVRKRDNYICQECGKHQRELGQKLSVHHIDYDKKNNDLKNLIVLCNDCHLKTNFSRKDWTERFKRRLRQI